ncbi:MAG: heme-binding protein [Pseudolabrys sp.]|nr:heme-binding protein [Pseudolabrys sp.]MBV9953771.1 heme-binding protein [Pseudolabrys sp.]
MKRSSFGAAAFCAAVLAAASAFAQAPPAPSDNPNDAVADQANAPAYGEPINTETAKKAAAAALDEAKKRNWNVFCVAIVNPAGELVYFEKQDNCQNASITISQHKARTAARYRRATLVFERLIGRGAYFNYLTTLDDVIASRGGNPIMMGGKIVGAIGVSGGSGAQDDAVSMAGVGAIK